MAPAPGWNDTAQWLLQRARELGDTPEAAKIVDVAKAIAALSPAALAPNQNATVQWLLLRARQMGSAPQATKIVEVANALQALRQEPPPKDTAPGLKP